MSGTNRNGTWSCTLDITQWSRVVEWRLRTLAMHDANHNVTVLDAAALSAFPALTVTGPVPDVTAPSLTSIPLSPATIQKGDAGADVTATFSDTDDLRGPSEEGSYAACARPRASTQRRAASGSS